MDVATMYDEERRKLLLFKKANGATRPITLIPFDEIEASTEPEYVIERLIPAEGLTVVWGPPKCYKSFWVQDMTMHAALGWEYRGRKVKQGPVVYCAFEGGTGFRKRCVAFRQKHLESYEDSVPFYLQPMRLDLVKEGERLIEAIRLQGITPIIVTLDTLNRSLVGSESKDEDMSAYIAVADRIREEFHCAVIIVHHCGVETSRPRGHTSLGGAVDAQHAVKRIGTTSTLTVEYMKDGEEGAVLTSQLEMVDIYPTLRFGADHVMRSRSGGGRSSHQGCYPTQDDEKRADHVQHSARSGQAKG